MWAREVIKAMNTALHVESIGSGKPIVMLHGWGMHAGMLTPLAHHLSRTHRAAAVDLPGHGASTAFAQFDNLEKLAEYIVKQLLPVFERGVVLLGWSLGGLVAQAIAIAYPKYINKLVLFCSTPCFIQASDWHCAISHEVLDSFAADLLRDEESTLSRFLSLQFLSAPDQKVRLREARRLLFARPRAQIGALKQGLALLKQSDLRPQLGEISCPTLVINAERDALVPPAAGQYLAEQVGDGHYVIIKGAGHAPFLSHTSVVCEFLDQFIDEH